MKGADKGKWIKYCKSLGVNPYSREVIESDYYQEGFKEWERLQGEFNYYRYMSYNF
jgi:hypothetical protein